jgi:hypothetical protein
MPDTLNVQRGAARSRTRSRVQRRSPGAWRSASFLAWPLVCYLGFTLGVPLANGAYSQREFWAHVAVVLVVVASLVGGWLIIRWVWSRLSRRNRT